jgi:CheY-like chemotaxis protein
VLSAVSGPAALDVLYRGRPDLVLMDFAMPGMNGAEAAGPARQRSDVFASGYADTAAVQNALAGQAVILRKPFDMDELATTVAAAVRPEAAGANSPVSH